MVVFPNCKINLGLRVLQKRADGFHDIETIFYPVPVRDALEIITLPPAAVPQLTVYGLPIAGDPADNLCMKAWWLLKKDFPTLPAVAIHLLKNIPAGAGLGGGSADGAAMLQLLNRLFQLAITDPQLAGYALQLGSDCPFFILNQPCLASGRGELLSPVPIDLSGHQLVLVNPGIHINTGWAFSQLNVNDLLTDYIPLRQAMGQSPENWPPLLINDFEKPVFEKYPAMAALRENLYRMGAVYAAMSGSGSTVYGLFAKTIQLPADLPAHYRVVKL